MDIIWIPPFGFFSMSPTWFITFSYTNFSELSFIIWFFIIIFKKNLLVEKHSYTTHLHTRTLTYVRTYVHDRTEILAKVYLIAKARRGRTSGCGCLVDTFLITELTREKVSYVFLKLLLWQFLCVSFHSFTSCFSSRVAVLVFREKIGDFFPVVASRTRTVYSRAFHVFSTRDCFLSFRPKRATTLKQWHCFHSTNLANIFVLFALSIPFWFRHLSVLQRSIKYVWSTVVINSFVYFYHWFSSHHFKMPPFLVIVFLVALSISSISFCALLSLVNPSKNFFSRFWIPIFSIRVVSPWFVFLILVV